MRDTTPSVLVVDDAESTRLILEHAFRGAGYEAVSVGSVQDALIALRRTVPAVAVIDAVLRDDSGFAICRTLRTEPAFAATRIIVISGSPEVQMKAKSFPGAYDIYLDKPFSLRVIVDHLRRLAPPPAALTGRPE